MNYFTLRGWLMPAAAGLLLAACQGQPATSSEKSPTVIKNENATGDTASVPAPAGAPQA